MRRFFHKAMDTEFTISFRDSVDGELCASAAAAAFRLTDNLEMTLSRFIDTSDIGVIRNLKPGEVAVISPETMDILLISAMVCAATEGAFDPTVGPMMNRIRESKSVTKRYLAQCGMGRIILDPDHNRISVKSDSEGKATPVELDFGGIGKGFALDRIDELLSGEEYGLSEYLLDAGTSTILARGFTPWPLGVGGRWKSRTKHPTIVELSHGALSGSGFELQGQHILNSRNGTKASEWIQSWSRSSSAAIADALSTAALSMDAKLAKKSCADLNAALLLARDDPGIIGLLRDPLVEIADFFAFNV